MNLSELLSNETLRREEFPVVAEKVFLAHAGVCPLPRRVAEAIGNYTQQCSLGDQETLLPAFRIQETRALAARLLGADPDEISIVGPTSLGLNLIATGLTLQKDDNILLYHEDYPANVYPWMAWARKGVEVRFLKVAELGQIHPADVFEQLNERTRLVALASAHYISGFRIDLTAIGSELHRRNILFCVDGIQTLGAFPMSVGAIDFLAADAHKWLLGPCAAGLLFVKRAATSSIRPALYGWHNVRSPGFLAQDRIELREDGRRFEIGSQNLLGLVGLHASLELLLEIGIDNIASELLRKRSWLIPALQEKGFEVLHADVLSPNASSILSFHRKGADMGSLHRKLEEANVVTTLRTDRAGNRYIRLSPHFYNTDAELHRLLELL